MLIQAVAVPILEQITCLRFLELMATLGHSASILGFDISSIGANKIVTGLKLNVYLNGLMDKKYWKYIYIRTW